MRKNKGEKTQKLMVGFIAFIMISSIFGVIFYGYSNEGGTKLRYNGFKFIKSGSLWITKIDGRQAAFAYAPADLESIEIDSEVISLLKDKAEIDLTADSNDTFVQGIALAYYQLKQVFSNFNIYARDGYTSENDFGMPIITCKDSTASIPVVYFREGDSIGIELEENCVIAEAARSEDFIAIKDRLVYGILGIIN